MSLFDRWRKRPQPEPQPQAEPWRRVTMTADEAAKSAYGTGRDIGPGDPMYALLRSVIDTGTPMIVTIADQQPPAPTAATNGDQG